MLSFFPQGVLDEILNLIELVSEGFPYYSFMLGSLKFLIRYNSRYLIVVSPTAFQISENGVQLVFKSSCAVM